MQRQYESALKLARLARRHGRRDIARQWIERAKLARAMVALGHM